MVRERRGFYGSSYELKRNLERQKKRLDEVLSKGACDEEQRKKIIAYVNIIDDILALDYFFLGSSTLSMPELIQDIKIRRNRLLESIKKQEAELEVAKCEKERIMAREGHIASRYDSDYGSEGQEELEEAYNYVLALECWISEDKTYSRIYHWLLGIINNSHGFFGKLYEGGMSDVKNIWSVRRY